ncbi:MAG: glutamate racemase [Candidatus Wallbacteria bacterium HGW-Wallbacteria-1]|jgi:glutamate racemase|uniref:Glutamate racemase n=1 Tax=Candidatus Wallbacteria bacterium HGW-Wallbacteria-1 TaxID=2013854 RepID=A0A2N1PUE9_9BACT|nr:MAG: glutamate racemase [Candidatus Wallbacteria bacterium HGW-Wallbacteria-1]
MGKRRETSKPLGIFDSGIGGMTVTMAIKNLLPDEKIVYYGDTARVPYGPKSPETIIRFSSQICNFLVHRDVKIIVIACNSASSSSLEHLRNTLSIPVMGVIEPGARAAVRATRSGRVAIIGTRATVESESYNRAIAALSPDIHVISRACPLLVPLVEEGWTDFIEAKLIVKRYLHDILRDGVDTIILGCTHYPLLKNVISHIAGPGITLIDSAHETALEVRELLAREGLLSLSANGLQGEKHGIASEKCRYYVSDSPDSFSNACKGLFGTEIENVHKVKVWELSQDPEE